MKNKKNYYTILGLSYKNSPEEITQEQVKKAYKKLSLQNHPDKMKDKEKAHLQTVEINEAYSILSDSNKRKEYNEKIVAQEEEELSLLCVVELSLAFAHSMIQGVPYLILINCIKKLEQLTFQTLVLPSTNLNGELQETIGKTQADCLELINAIKALTQQLLVLIALVDLLVEKKDKDIKKEKQRKNANPNEFQSSYRYTLNFIEKSLLKLKNYNDQNNSILNKDNDKKKISKTEFIPHNEASKIKKNINICSNNEDSSEEETEFLSSKSTETKTSKQDNTNTSKSLDPEKEPLNIIYEKIKKAFIYISKSKNTLLELKENDSYSMINPTLSQIFDNLSSIIESFSNIKSNIEKIEKFVQQNDSAFSTYQDPFLQMFLLMINALQTMHTNNNAFPSRPIFFSFPSENIGENSDERQILKF